MSNQTNKELLKQGIKVQYDWADTHRRIAEGLEKQLADLSQPKIVQGRYVTAPEKGTKYYVVISGCAATLGWHDLTYDHRRLAQGEAFATEEHAEKSLLKRQALQAMRGCEGAKEFEVGGHNYELYWNQARWGITENGTCATTGDIVWFDTEEHALAAIHSLSPEMQVALR